MRVRWRSDVLRDSMALGATLSPLRGTGVEFCGCGIDFVVAVVGKPWGYWNDFWQLVRFGLLSRLLLTLRSRLLVMPIRHVA